MRTDLNYCMNSYLSYRAIVDHQHCFSDELEPWFFRNEVERSPVNTADELDRQLRRRIDEALAQGPVGLMLSGGMDSAILASYLPQGTQTYTLHCIADSGIDETEAAKRFADLNHLKHFNLIIQCIHQLKEIQRKNQNQFHHFQQVIINFKNLK